MKLNWDRGQNI